MEEQILSHETAQIFINLSYKIFKNTAGIVVKLLLLGS
jgi:hypothetical protein